MCLQVGLHGWRIVLQLSIHAPQGVPGHSSAVALPIPIIIVGGVADESVGSERYVALVVGLGAQDGIECPLLIAERGEGDAVEREVHDLGRGIELRLQPLELAHVPVPATPHAEGGEKQAIYHGAELHNVHYFCLCRKSSNKRANNMKPVSIFITASAEYFRGLPQKSRDYSRYSKRKAAISHTC